MARLPVRGAASRWDILGLELIKNRCERFGFRLLELWKASFTRLILYLDFVECWFILFFLYLCKGVFIYHCLYMSLCWYAYLLLLITWFMEGFTYVSYFIPGLCWMLVYVIFFLCLWWGVSIYYCYICRLPNTNTCMLPVTWFMEGFTYVSNNIPESCLMLVYIIFSMFVLRCFLFTIVYICHLANTNTCYYPLPDLWKALLMRLILYPDFVGCWFVLFSPCFCCGFPTYYCLYLPLC